MKGMKTQRVCRDFLRMQGGCTMDAMKAAAKMAEVWGIRVDHHEMSYALEHIERAHDATYVGRGADGFIEYYITAR